MDPTVPSTAALLTTGGLSLFTTAIVEVVLRALQKPALWQRRFGPLLAMVVAIAAAVAAAIWLSSDLFTAVIAGVFVGFASMGMHDSARAVVG